MSKEFVLTLLNQSVLAQSGVEKHGDMGIVHKTTPVVRDPVLPYP